MHSERLVLPEDLSGGDESRFVYMRPIRVVNLNCPYGICWNDACYFITFFV